MPVWMRYRPVTVEVSVTVVDGEDPNAVRDRILASLGDLLSPCEARPLERMLRASDVYDRILAVPGVQYADRLRLTIKDAPDGTVNDLVRESAPGSPALRRHGQGPLPIGRSRAELDAPGRGHPRSAIPVGPDLAGAGGPRGRGQHRRREEARHDLGLQDSGDSWEQAERLQGEEIHDIAWIARDGRPILLLATRVALRRLDIGSGHGSEMLARLQPGPANRSGRASMPCQHPSSLRRSADGGGQPLPGRCADLERWLPARHLHDAARARRQRCPRSALPARRRPRPASGRPVSLGRGGGRRHHADRGPRGRPRSHRLDQLRKGLDGRKLRSDRHRGRARGGGHEPRRGSRPRSPASRHDLASPPIDCGLPITPARNTLLPVTAVLAAATDDPGGLLAGTEQGLFTSEDTLRFNPTGRANFTDRVPLPPYQLYCSGDHRVTVRRNHDAEED